MNKTNKRKLTSKNLKDINGTAAMKKKASNKKINIESQLKLTSTMAMIDSFRQQDEKKRLKHEASQDE
jgi:hypothetical protein